MSSGAHRRPATGLRWKSRGRPSPGVELMSSLLRGTGRLDGHRDDGRHAVPRVVAAAVLVERLVMVTGCAGDESVAAVAGRSARVRLRWMPGRVAAADRRLSRRHLLADDGATVSASPDVGRRVLVQVLGRLVCCCC